jgi:hypothetical protein
MLRSADDRMMKHHQKPWFMTSLPNSGVNVSGSVMNFLKVVHKLAVVAENIDVVREMIEADREVLHTVKLSYP